LPVGLPAAAESFWLFSATFGRNCSLGPRPELKGSSDTYDYYYNQQWQVLEVRKDDDVDPEKQYVYHPHYVDAITLRYWDKDGSTNNGMEEEHYYLQDANFNVTAVVDETGDIKERYNYTPYGEVTVLDINFPAVSGNVSAISNDLLYTGRRSDPETGLQLNRNRFYASHLGRWVNRDPVGYAGQSMNLYEYVGGMPMRGLDPKGLSFSEGVRCWLKYGYSDCNQALGCAEYARFYAEDFNGGDKEAMRHCMWLCCMAQRLKNKNKAMNIASIHERLFPSEENKGDTCRDKYNNGIGAAIGDPVTNGEQDCKSACQDALDNDFLQTEPGCGGFKGPNCPSHPNG